MTFSGDLTIDSNTNLNSLNGLNTTSIPGTVIISNNTALTDISQLESVLSILGNLSITGNPALDECCLVRNFLNSSNYISGNIAISGNNTNCASIPVIITSCTVTQADDDNDSIINTNDNCINIANSSQSDADGDGIGDACDNCPNTANASQTDSNNNGIGDACEGNASIDTGLSSGGVGIGTTAPHSQLEIATGDVFITNKYRGIIMKSSDNKCFRYQPDTNGNLVGREIICPDN
ncbi:MAG: thrombospondin type 3 repeat-containing protein [Flavobacteriaceae bacterium]|nr:thrombospondin type 3 repeat-containing protein [Flavobacteriaceae bacterium]